MFRSRIIPVALVTVIAVGAAGAVLASSETNQASERQEITAIANAKTSLAQAIAVAEQESGGKAVSAAIEDHKGVIAYEVEVTSGSKLQKILVDPETGKVTKTMAANADHDEDGEQDKD